MKKLDDAYEEFLIEIYKISEPKADFKELLKNATINERGQKEIPYNDYEVDQEEFNKLIESIAKKHKLKTKYELDSFRFHCHLGATPKFK